MKVLLINPPNVRSENSKKENDFKISGFTMKPIYFKIPLLERVLKICNKYFGLGKGIRYGVRAGSRWPWTLPMPPGPVNYPFFMAYAGSNLKSLGHEVAIIDSIAEREIDYEKILNRIKKLKFDIVIVECSTPTIDIDLWFCSKIADCNVQNVVLAGPHLNKENVEKISIENPKITNFLLGEYILSTGDLVNNLSKKVFESRVLKDVDTIPFPYRDFNMAEMYYDPSMPTAKPQLQIYGSKGCPFKCTFCSWPQNMYAGSVALRAPEKIAEEIKESIKLHGYRSIFFDDDTFNLGTERISKLCDYLKEINLPWTMMGRLDVSPDWLYDKMVESGCVGMRFGIETFNLDVLKNVKKGIERKDFRGTLEHISTKYPDLMIHITMMKDMPGMTEEMHREDMDIISKMGFRENSIKRSYQLSRCVPFPGTELYRQMKEKYGEEKLEDYKKYDGGVDTVMKDF